MKPATNEECRYRSAPWIGTSEQFPKETTTLGLKRLEAMIRFGRRWQFFWIDREWYIASGLSFAVVDALAAIEGRRAWDKPHDRIRFFTPLVRFPR